MVNYIFRRLLGFIPLMIGISLVVFFIIQIPPGDYADTYKSELINQGGMTGDEAERQAQKFRERYGLDKPLFVQYANWVKDIVSKGKFGYSFRYKKDVGDLIAERLPWTLLIAILSHMISTLVGVFAGIYVAPRQYSFVDNLGALLAFILTSIPRFTLALIIIYLLMFKAGVQHVSSLFSPEYVMAPWSLAKVGNLLQHIWPAIVIAGLGGVARNFRVMRGNLLDVINSPYTTTARAKGLTERKVMFRHAVPNALHPIIMYQGMVLPYMIQGELIVSIVLGLPTLGPLFYSSLVHQDLYVSASFLMVYAFLLIVGNLIADILLSALDPRIRYS